MSSIFGLDFGTSNSALSVNNNEEVKLIAIDKHNISGKTLKSKVYPLSRQ